MRTIRFAGLPFLMFVLVTLAVMSVIILELWNILMPAIFRLPPITFWQAAGILFLSRVLFGRLGDWGRRMRKSRVVHGWKDLTPEERQRFSEAMKGRDLGNLGAND